VEAPELETELERPQDACEPDCECPEGFEGVEPFCQPIEVAPPVEEVAPPVEEVAPPGDAVEEEKPAEPAKEPEEVVEPIIVPEENTITGDDEEEIEPEEAPKLGASTDGVSSLRAEGLIVAVFASFLALLV